VVASASISGGSVDTDTGGRTALLVLALVALLPLLIRTMDVRGPRWLPWAIGSVSAGITLLLGLLIDIGRDAAAWAIYAGLQLLRAREHYSDLAWVLRWVECEGCERWDPGYAQGILWLHPATLGLIRESWTPILGTALTVLLSLCLVWLARTSGPRGLPVYAIAAVGGGWLLLLDRGNLDAVVLALAVIAAAGLRRNQHLWVWAALAAAFWVVGTWKYYPFALGLMLIPVVRQHRGWVVLAGYAAATVAFLVANWAQFASGPADNSRALILYDFPALGRLPVIARLVPEFSLEAQPLWGNLLVGLLALTGVAWGAVFALRLPGVPVVPAMMGSAGSAVFLASVLVAGFGFAYKAAFLLLIVPLLARPLRPKEHFLLYTSLVTLLLIAIPLIVGYSILLTSLAGILAASIGLGASLTVLTRWLRDSDGTLTSRARPRRGTGPAAHASSPVR
jgi:hypothetical protein